MSTYVKVRLGSWEGTAELADSLVKKIMGLMFRRKPTPMVFPIHGKASFWMLFVPFPLKLVFLKDNRVVKVEVMEPCRGILCKIYKGEGDYAIELPVEVEVKVNDYGKVEMA